MLRYLGAPTRRGHIQGNSFSPLSLFSASQQGAWFDPSDITTLYQDSAGTVPVTAVEQPVGKILDKSGNGNHATQATAGNRPTWRARYNLLTYSQDFTNAAWSNTAVTVSGSAPDPFGGTNANFCVPTASASQHTLESASLMTTGVTYTASVYAKYGSIRYLTITSQGSANQGACFDLTTQSLAIAVGSSVTGTSITNVGGGWFRYSVTAVAAFGRVSLSLGTATSNGFQSYTGDGVSGSYLFGADLRTGTNSSYSYQSITTATSYNAVGFLPYLAFNGTTSAMATASIPFTAAQMSVFAGLTKNSDAAQAVIAELSTSIASNNGTFLLSAPNSAAANFNFSAKGTSEVDNTVTSFAAPYTAVLTGLSDLGAPTTSIQVNNGAPTSLATATGGGVYGNFPLYIGARAGTSLFAPANIYGLIVRGSASTAAEVSSTIGWLDSRTGAY